MGGRARLQTYILGIQKEAASEGYSSDDGELAARSAQLEAEYRATRGSSAPRIW